MIKTYYHTPTSDAAENSRVARYVSCGLWGHGEGFTEFSTMDVQLHGRTIGGTVFHNWHPQEGVLELSSYSDSPRWLTRHSINAMMYFPFTLMACQLVVMRVSDRNDRMNAIASRFGFTAHHIPRLRGPNEGEYIHTLTREEWESHPLRIKDFSANISA